MNELAIPEMIEWTRKIGYQARKVADLANPCTDSAAF